MPDVTIVRILQITSITSSIFYFSAQALYKVRNHYHLFFTLITFENLQFLHNEYVMGKFNLLLYLGGKEVEFLVVMFFYLSLSYLALFLRWSIIGRTTELEGEYYFEINELCHPFLRILQ